MSFLERVGAGSGSAGVVGAMGAGVFDFFMTAEPFGFGSASLPLRWVGFRHTQRHH
jgi:hypothetical protein